MSPTGAVDAAFCDGEMLEGAAPANWNSWYRSSRSVLAAFGGLREGKSVERTRVWMHSRMTM